MKFTFKLIAGICWSAFCWYIFGADPFVVMAGWLMVILIV